MMGKRISGMKHFSWRLNEDILNQQPIVNYSQGEINSYFQANLNKGTQVQTGWDACKAVMRGALMALNSKDKKKIENVKKIQKNIKQKERELKKRPGKKKLTKDIKILQEQLNSLLNEAVCWNLKRLQQKSFEGANKPGKYLAW